MRILVISDTHRDNSNFSRLIAQTGKPDILVHCGDVCGSELVYEESVDCKVVMVSGNNELYTLLSDEELFEAGGHRIWVTHGHRYGVYYGTERLCLAAESRGADIVLYGHTHIPAVEYDEATGVIAANPGSLSLPRQDGRRPSYLMIEIDREDEAHFTINYL